MTTTIDPDVIAAIEAAPVPYDFFREVHKGLRHALFGVTEVLGAADLTVATTRDAALDEVHATIALLHSHHGHEDAFIKPLLDRHAPGLSAIVDAGHVEVDERLVDIELLADKVGCAEGAEAVSLGLDLYRTVALFTAQYLAHMALEEGDVMAALRAAMTTAELFEVDMALRAAVPPETMCAFIAVMAPAMNPEERTSMLGGIKAGAPAEVFEVFRAAAEAALTPSDYRTVAARLGLA